MASESAQTKQIIKICSFLMPCLSTKAFCAPMAKMSEKPRLKPEINAFIIVFFVVKIKIDYRH